MGIFDFLKKGKPDPKKIVEASYGLVNQKISVDSLKDMAEDAAKDKIKDVAEDVVNDKIDEILGSKAPKGFVRNKLVEKAVDMTVDKVWDDIKDKLA